MTSLVIFDLDGTLVNSASQVADAFRVSFLNDPSAVAWNYHLPAEPRAAGAAVTRERFFLLPKTLDQARGAAS